MDALAVAKDLVIPALSVMGSVAAAFASYRHRMDALEKEQTRYLQDTEKRLESLKQGFRLEMEGLKAEIARVEKDLEGLRRNTENLKDSSADFAKDAELSRYITEENRKWNEMQRLLGQIEGQLARLK